MGCLFSIYYRYHRVKWEWRTIMENFKPIETQEELDRVIGERLKRERETTEKKFEGYLSPDDVKKNYEGYLSPEDVKKKYENYLSPEEAAKKDAEIKRYESDSVKTRIANELGLPLEMAQRLQGSNEESIRKDAEALAKVLGSAKKVVAPLRSTETQKNDARTEAYRDLVKNLGKE